jgi:hypothetical protein
MLKVAKLKDEATLRAEREYVTTNPHADVIREIAAAANISYGRIDYALLDGAMQVWEFNTNPMIAGRWVGQHVSEPQRSAASKLLGRLARPAARRFPAVRAVREARRQIDVAPGVRDGVHESFVAGLAQAWIDFDDG